jgi:chloramphenicol-sensitive protein RarD
LSNHYTDRQKGLFLGVIANLIWGLAALYWVQTEPVSSVDLVAHRALWSVPVLTVLLLFRGKLREALCIFRQPRQLAQMACAATANAANWGVFLWAITHEQVTDASLGYFLLPLLNVVVGVMLFRESLGTAQKIGVAFAVLAVSIQVAYLGTLPWVALGVAVSFTTYSAIRKGTRLASTEGLFIETLLMAPFALAWLAYSGGAGLGQYGFKVDFFLLAAGLMTVIPLMAYVASSRLMALTDLGMVFYLGPTVQLLVA